MGQGVGLISSIEPAGYILQRMMNDAAGVLAAFSSRT
jgi:hypothetical protein